MARISTYSQDTSISNDDLLIGTDAEDSNITKNFSVNALRSFIGSGGNLLTKKISVTTDQLKVINTTPLIVVDVAEDEVADIVSVIAKVSNQTTDNNLNFPDNLTIEPSDGYGTSYEYILPSSFLNSNLNFIYKPIAVAGNTTPGPITGDVRLKSINAQNTPTETGTATTKLDIWVTYQIIDLTDL